MDAATGGAFLSLTIRDAIALVEKMASNQSWNKERTQTHNRGGGIVDGSYLPYYHQHNLNKCLKWITNRNLGV
jgi:hypothetical protein